MKYLQLNDIDAYKRSFSLANYLWEIINKWSYFAKQTIGLQYIKALDSISANIAEGFGRYAKKDKIRFYKIAYSSTYESLDWNEKAKIRNLLNPKKYKYILDELKRIQKEINQLIKYTNTKLKK